VALDLRAAQSRHYRERGIARYAVDFACAVVEHDPELVGSVIVDPDLPPVQGIDAIAASGRLTAPAAWKARERLFHVMSPFDLDVPIRQLWPRRASRADMRLIVTVYDLIPHIFPEIYLPEPVVRAVYSAHRHLVRAADHIVTLSSSAATDLTHNLGVDGRKITMIGAACGRQFVPPESRTEAAELATELLPGLERHFVVYNGGVEPRKNMERLIEAYAGLSDPVRTRWQLVLVCRMDPTPREFYERMARRLGIEGRLVLTGFVDDDALVLLYQGAGLVVYPSLYEGYGLPVTEAMACGAPVIASGSSSLPALVAPEACFDPRDTSAITAMLERALTDEPLRQRLTDWSSKPPPNWRDVATRVAGVYRRAIGSRRRSVTVHKPRLAFMAAPDPTEAAAHDLSLVEALSHFAIVDVVVDRTCRSSPKSDYTAGARRQLAPGAALVGADTLERAAALRGGYDAVIVSLCNGRHGVGALRLLRRRTLDAPVVVAHDVRLIDLYWWAAATGAVPEGFVAAARAMYPWLSENALAGPSPRAAAERLGLLLVREAISRSRLFLASSACDADYARSDAAPESAGRIGVLPDAMDVAERAERLVETVLGRAAGP
jgi:glycosyltransferase involved in cell wall biosynthesis